MATNGKRNRSAGHDWERECIKLLREIHPHIVSSRAANRARDGEGIDFCNADEAFHGRLIDDIQAKNSAKPVSYAQSLARMKGRPFPVIFHKYTARIGDKFITKDKFAITYLGTYLNLLKYRTIAFLIKENLEHLPEELRKRVEELFPTD